MTRCYRCSQYLRLADKREDRVGVKRTVRVPGEIGFSFRGAAIAGKARTIVEVQLFERFGYGRRRHASSRLGRGARGAVQERRHRGGGGPEGGEVCKVTPLGQVWLPVKSPSEIIIFIIREFAERAPASCNGTTLWQKVTRFLFFLSLPCSPAFFLAEGSGVTCETPGTPRRIVEIARPFDSRLAEH